MKKTGTLDAVPLRRTITGTKTSFYISNEAMAALDKLERHYKGKRSRIVSALVLREAKTLGLAK